MEELDVRILIVDDEEWILRYMREILEDTEAHLHFAMSADEGLNLIRRYDIDLILCDVHLRGLNGIEFLQQIRTGHDPPEVIMMTGFGSIDGAVDAMRHEAFDYLTKPLDKERVVSTVRRALDRRALVQEVRTLRTQMLASHGDQRLVVVSSTMKDTMALVVSASVTDTTVLIEGESGTGKEIIARTIHRYSPRSNGPFIPVNCGALPETLLESELFGYRKGAFTGAATDRKGLFESAEGGTILLDEVGELPLPVQTSLLRVLQEREIRRVGDTSTRTIDVRFIAATNRSLRERVDTGRFREDLYYRFRVVPIFVPPLRERTDDILPLVRYFLDEYGRRYGKTFRAIEPEAAQFLLSYSWPGNVRELENLVHGVVALFEGDYLTRKQINGLLQTQRKLDSPAESNGSHLAERISHGATDSLADDRNNAESNAIEEALQASGGKQSRAAERLGISRTSLWRKMKKYGIDPNEWGGGA